MAPAWPLWLDAAAVFAAAALGAVAVAILVIRRWAAGNDPDEKERLRRLDVNSHGRIVNGEVVDIVDEESAPNGAVRRLIHYRYSVDAVHLAACQDVTMIAHLIGDDPGGIVGPVNVKHHNRNPYNSIIVCETWSGLRRSKDVSPTASAAKEAVADEVR